MHNGRADGGMGKLSIFSSAVVRSCGSIISIQKRERHSPPLVLFFCTYAHNGRVIHARRGKRYVPARRTGTLELEGEDRFSLVRKWNTAATVAALSPVL